MTGKLIYSHKLPCGVFEVYDDRPNFDLIKCKQIHSAEVLPINKATEDKEADGVVAPKLYTPLAVVTADCLPIALCGTQGVAMIHAGWRGLADEILAHELIKNINPTFAFIGPHICADNYEVSLDFQDNFKNSKKAFQEIDGKLYFSLEIEARQQLAQLYGPISIESSNICTYKNNELNSYRENKTSKRNWNVLRME